MKTAALVPFKCFTRAKRRLRTSFADEAVEELGRAMLLDVLDALLGAPSLESVSVLTDDQAVAEVARRAGAQVRIETPDPGLNPAIDLGNASAEAAGCDATLVMLGDLPLLQSADIEAVLAAGSQHPVVIVPSEDGGTALLYRRPPGCIPARFGKDSAAAHIQAARDAGVEPRVLAELDECVRVDLDTPEDAKRVVESGIPSRTGELLRRLGA